MAHSRRRLLATLAAAGGAGLAGCNTRDGSTTRSSSESSTSTTAESDESTAPATGDSTAPNETDSRAAALRTLSAGSRLRYFGGSVAVSESIAVVGADTIGGIVATVFTRANGSWSQTTQFTPANVEASFGRVPVAAADGALLVGSVAYTQTDGGWRRQRLTPDEQRITQSPQSVALGTDTAVVGAGTDRAVSRFTRTGDGWSHAATLTHPDGDTGFGRVVAVDGDRLVVGAPRADEVHVFDGDTHETTLGPDVDRPFAPSLALSGDRLLAGTQGQDSEDAYSGGALVFEQTGDDWRQTRRLTPTDDGGSNDADHSNDPDGEWIGNYGGELALSGDTAVVSGAWSETPQRQNGVELVAVFDRDNDGWRRRTIRSPDPPLGPVALGPESVLVGAPMERDGGVVYVADR